MNKTHTKAWTRRAQISGAVLLLAAGGLAFASIPGLGGVGDLPEAKPVTPPKLSVGIAAAHVDSEGLAGQLNRLSMPMGQEKPPPPPAPVATSPDEPQPSPTKVEVVWEYIGGIIAPAARRAIVTIEGVQKMLTEGQSEGETRLQAVTADYIIIAKGGEETKIDRKALKARSGLASANGIKPSASAAAAARLAAAANQGLGAGSAAGASGPVGSKPLNVAGAANPKDAAARALAEKAKNERFSDPAVRDKVGRIYADIMRSNGGERPDPATLAKFGIEGFEPSDEEVERMQNDPDGIGGAGGAGGAGGGGGTGGGGGNRGG